ncbi:MAG: hypothetical protein ACKOD9_21700 [Rubrivivax sp.]
MSHWLIPGHDEPASGPGQAGRPSRASVAVVTCAWQPDAGRAGEEGLPRELADWLVLSGVQRWSGRVSGSFAGQTRAGTGLLLVPVYEQAQETALALRRFLEAASRAMGGQDLAASWELKIIGPLSPGAGPEVRQQLAKAGWPVS